MAENVETLVIDNFHGSMTPYFNGDINSGRAFTYDVFGYDPFTKPGDLTWNESAVRIDPNESVITDLILCGKTRVESGITYVYCVGHTGRVYKIQVNDTTTYNPDYDNPVLLTTLTSGTPTFTKGAFIDFFGATERMYIGHDKGVTRLDFAGTNETVVGSAVSWTQTVPRPLKQFLGKMYVGNGTNLAEIDSTATVSTYTKLSPAFPTNSQVRDLDVTPDGSYLDMVVTEQGLNDVTSTSTDASIGTVANSFIFKWNGTDTGYTSFITYPNTTLTANCTFGNQQYVFGYDFLGGAIYNPIQKVLTSTPVSAYSESPSPNAVISISNTITWMTPLPFEGNIELIWLQFGTISGYEIQPGFWCNYNQGAQDTETDVVRIPCQILVSNFAQGTSTNGYASNIFSQPKIYFSTLETSATTTKYKLYKWNPIPTGLGTSIDGGVYQTQSQQFSKKVKPTEVRIYGEPWVANNAFTIDIIDSSDSAIANGSMTFTAGTNLTIGSDFAWYNPSCAPLYSFAIRITNAGTVNHTISRIEIDYVSAGK